MEKQIFGLGEMGSNWDKRWMELVEAVSGWSKDCSRKVGAVIVDYRNNVVSLGWNGFPRGVNDDVDERHERPQKYKWTEHAERNAIYNAAANGYPLKNTTIYLQWYPCADCARAIIQSGIEKVVGVEPDWDDPTYGDEFGIVKQMLGEAGIVVQFMDDMEAPKRLEKSYFNHKSNGEN